MTCLTPNLNNPMDIADIFEGAAYLQGPEVTAMLRRAHHCAGKTQFANPALAHKVADRSGRQTYRCRSCGFYHVGGGIGSINRKARQASNLVRPE